jgi:GT2 family glycosyltransferase
VPAHDARAAVARGGTLQETLQDLGNNPPVTTWLRQLAEAARSANRRRLERRHAHKGLTYSEWIRRHDTLDAGVLQALQARLGGLPHRPLISVLMPVYNPEPRWLAEAIASVEQQLYPQWELCIADDCSTDPEVQPVLAAAARRDARIRVVRRERNGHISHASNSALAMAGGEFVALLDHDDALPAHALLLVAEAIVHHPRARLLYSDEDVVRTDGQRLNPAFKPDWNPGLMQAQNLVCHLGVYETALLRQIGGFRPGLEGAQDYDLALRCIEQLQDDQILHIPHVLYHWRLHPGSSAAGAEVKPYIAEAGRRALHEHLLRRGVSADVTASAGGGYRVRPRLPAPGPGVSLLVRGATAAGALQRHGHLLKRPADAGCVVLECLVCPPGGEAAAAEQARGEFLCLLADGVEITEAAHLDELVALAGLPGTGAVGARLQHADGRLAHGGYILGAGGGVGAAHAGLPAGGHGYRSRAVMNQNLAAVSADCLLVRRSHFLAVGGFDAALGSGLRDVDLCLRLAAHGLRTLWAAHAVAVQHHVAPPAPWPEGELQHLQARWSAMQRDDPAYNPNLDLETAGFHLAPEPRVCLSEPWFLRASAPGRRNTPPPMPAAAPTAP